MADLDERQEEIDQVGENNEGPAGESAAGQEVPQILAEKPAAKPLLEALLFASDGPLTVEKLGEIAGVEGRRVRELVDELNAEYEAAGRAFRIEEIGGGFQMLTLPDFAQWVGMLRRSQVEARLSKAALETLAIIAYKQPVLRAEVEAIRGVQSGQLIRSLMDKGLVRVSGREEVPGRPILYGTTRRFLEVFGLGSVGDLPKMDELIQP